MVGWEGDGGHSRGSRKPLGGDFPLRRLRRDLRRAAGEADEFYAAVQPPALTDDERLVQRQALAGLLWSKQYYDYDVETG